MAVIPKFDASKEAIPVFRESVDPEPVFREPVQSQEPIDVRASNSVWLKSKMGGVDDNTLDVSRDTYLDQVDSSDEGMYQQMSSMIMKSVEPINVEAMLKEWNAVTGAPSDVLREAPGFTWNSFLQKRKRALAEWWVAGTEEGGQKLIMDWMDFWPSKYRGVKELVGLEDFDVPVIDNIADFTGGLKKDATIRQQMFLDHLKESGHLKEAATLKTLDAVGETLIFLNEVKRLGMRYGGKTGEIASRWQKILNTLGHAQKMSLFTALTAEDATAKERAKMWFISSLYMSTPAVSSQVKGKAAAVTADMLLNSVISALKEGGYRDIVEDEEMDGFDKIMAAVELLGSDAVFSAMTKPYKGTDYNPQVDVDRMAEDISLQLMNPRQAQIRLSMNPVEMAKQQTAITGRGGVKIDEAKMDAEKTIEATKQQLEREIAEAQKEIEKPAEPEKKPEAEARPEERIEIDPQKLAEEMMADKTAEALSKQAVLDVIKETEGQPAEERLIAVRDRIGEIGEIMGENVPVKTRINRINRVRKKPVREEITISQFYKTMEQVSKAAEKAGVRGVGEAKAEYMKFADERFTWKEAEAFEQKLDAAIKRGVPVDQFVRVAEREAQKLLAPKKEIERTIPIKDLSKQAKVSEAEALRSVLREAEKAAIGARRATIDKITMTNKDMKTLLNQMDAKTRGKVIKAVMNVATARTDEAREKALEAFKPRALDLIDAAEYRQAKADYDKAVGGAKKIVADRKAKKWFRDSLEAVFDAKKELPPADELSLERQQLFGNAKQLREFLKENPVDGMTAGQLNILSGQINHLVKTHNQIVAEEQRYNKSKAQHDVEQQIGFVSVKKPDLSVRLGGKKEKAAEAAKTLESVQLIPQGLAEQLDYRADKGAFQTIQKSLVDSVVRESEFLTRTMDVIDPAEKTLTKLKTSKNGDRKRIPTTTFEVGVADRIQIYMFARNPYTREALKNEGFSHGMMHKAREGRKQIKFTDELIAEVEKMMSPAEREAAETMIRGYRVMGMMTSEHSLKHYGFDITPDKMYTGMARRSGTKAEADKDTPEFDVDPEKGIGLTQGFHQHRLENAGQFKGRAGSQNPLLAYDPVGQFRKAMMVSAKYYGYSVALDSANRFMNYAKRSGLRDQYYERGRQAPFNRYDTLIKQLNEPIAFKKDESARMVKNVVNFAMEYTAGTLKINPKVQLYQLASFEMAKPYMSNDAYKMAQKEFGKAFVGGAVPEKWSGDKIDEMSRRFPYINMRYRGRMGVSIGDQARTQKQMRGMGNIRKNDAAVIYAMMKGIEYDVRNSNIAPEKQEAEIELRLADAIERSQPSYELQSRPELARSESEIARRLTMFSSQRNKLFYNLNRGVGILFERVTQGEKISKDDFKKSMEMIMPVVKSQMIIAGIQTVFEQALLEMREVAGFERERPEGGWDLVKYLAGEYSENFALSMFGAMGNLTSLATSLAEGYEFEAVPVGSMVRDLGAYERLVRLYADYLDAEDAAAEDEWLEENRIRIGEELSEALNVLVMPTTGVNLKNAYRWGVEAPAALWPEKLQRRIREYDYDEVREKQTVWDRIFTRERND